MPAVISAPDDQDSSGATNQGKHGKRKDKAGPANLQHRGPGRSALSRAQSQSLVGGAVAPLRPLFLLSEVPAIATETVGDFLVKAHKAIAPLDLGALWI